MGVGVGGNGGGGGGGVPAIAVSDSTPDMPHGGGGPAMSADGKSKPGGPSGADASRGEGGVGGGGSGGGGGASSSSVGRAAAGGVDAGDAHRVIVREEWITHSIVVNPRPPVDVALFRLPARYANVSHIAAGTYGMVVAATDLQTGGKVAIKKMFEP